MVVSLLPSLHTAGYDPASSFEIAWRAARDVPGRLEENDARHLFQAGLEVPLDHCIVDVGMFHDRSCVLLAHTGRQIVMIDSSPLGDEPGNQSEIAGSTFTTLQERVKQFPNISWMRLAVQTCPLPERPIGLLHIKLDHNNLVPLQQFEQFRQGLSTNALVAFDGYCIFPEVSRAIAKLQSQNAIEEGLCAESMYISRIARPKAADVTGFHLFALCHRFGRRGRAFAASLANQVDSPYPIHLTIFYCDPVDATLVLEGALQGKHPPTLTLRQIPEHRIMQRAIYFASAHSSPECSHIVYLDSDLWFPKDFWSSYGEAVSREPAGYWSSFVRDVPFATSESLLSRWQDLQEEALQSQASGLRYDHFQGRVGHFQCVPSGLTRYPLDWINAVNRADETFARQAIELSLDCRRERRLGARSAYHFDHPDCWTGTSTLL